MPLSKIKTNSVADEVFEAGSNLIINGAMQVAQRATSATAANSVEYLTLDRWQYTYGDSTSNEYSSWTMSQDSDAPDGFSNSLKFICTTAASAPSTLTAALTQQKFEGQDLQQIQFAKSGAKTLTASFYVKSNQTGNIGVQLYAIDDNTMNSQLISIDTANTWEFKTVTFAAKTSGTEIPNDNTEGMRIRFVFEYNTGRAVGTANTWAAKQTNSQLVPAGTSARTSSLNDTFFLAGVQLEVGEQATPFQHRSFDDELDRCKRYYQKSFAYGTAPANDIAGVRMSEMPSSDSASYGGALVYLEKTMRANPTVVAYNPQAAPANSGAYINDLVNGTVTTEYEIASIVAYSSQLRFFLTTAPTTGGNPYGCNWTADAEL